MKKILLTICFFATVNMSAQLLFTSKTDGAWDGGTSVWTITDPTMSGKTNTTPQSTDDVTIAATHEIDINDGTNAVCNNLITTNNNTCMLDINAGASLTVSGNVTVGRFDNSIRLFHSVTKNAVFIVNGTITDKRIYQRRTLNKKKWFLISSPFLNAKKSKFLTTSTNTVTNSAANGFLSGDGTKTSFASYNDGNASGSKYVYTLEASKTTGNLTDAAGYSIYLDKASGTPAYAMQGKYHHGATTSVTISDAGNGYNLVGNAYLAYVYANNAANATHNVLLDNTGILDQETIWLWDGDSATWITKNQSDGTGYHISPGQGFFVKAKTGGGNFTFDKDLQTIDSSDDVFLKSSNNNRFEVDLNVTIGKQKRSASIRYIDNMTTDFDNGYDSSTFGGYASSFEVYTNLVGKDSGKKLAIQSLPNVNFEDMIIPVGVTADANSEITFSAKALNVPTGYKVFLEDRLNSTFTRLDEVDAEYTATVTEKTTEGRFYLHARTSALSLDSELLNSVRIYKSNTSTLKIVGLSQGKTNVSLYNVIGEQVLKASFNANGTKEISLPRLSSGVYVVQLETETGKVNKKIVLE
ncbi:T9SS type A sorting domain-containing protein [uncultured Polaribacter sp.]|uniref:T9SS type A sorting domain-containing protein n=1 Tax=uncultured Polaribacter sp. TaxID=174711 RepID=UPI00259B2FFA|nr:T9SS type A sorting domain-containing protein [uncultured Polaribacter sp.]